MLHIDLKELYLSTISNLKSLKPILNLDKLEKLDFGGSEELITNEILEFKIDLPKEFQEIIDKLRKEIE